MKKKIAATALASVIAVTGLSAFSASVSAEWVKSGSSYSYKDDSGNKLRGWQEIDGGRYYFDKDGKALTGWKKISGKTYYFNGAKKGRMVTGTVKIGGKTYEFGIDGVLKDSTSGKKASSGIPFGASKESIKKGVDTSKYEIITDDYDAFSYGTYNDDYDLVKGYGFIFDEDGKMQIYATSDLGNHVKSFKKSFADRGYKTKASVEGNTVMATDSSLLMIIYDSEYNCTYVMYVSPELSRELLEDGYTPEDLFEIADEYL